MIFCAAHKNEPEAMNMEKRYPETTQQSGRVGVLISRLALMLALAVLVLTVRTCCPYAVEQVKDWLGPAESPSPLHARQTPLSDAPPHAPLPPQESSRKHPAQPAAAAGTVRQ